MSNDYERGVKDAIRWRMTHIEQFSVASDEASVPFDDAYNFAMIPYRTKPDELLPGSAAHRERMINLVTEVAVRHLTAAEIA